MGEEIEIRDVNGNPVRVSLYATLANIGQHLAKALLEGQARGEDRQFPIECGTTTAVAGVHIGGGRGAELGVAHFAVDLVVRATVATPDGLVAAKRCACGDGSCMLCDDRGMVPDA